MAIKASNQVTFTEHKKVVEIKEWYLAHPEKTGVTVETEGWTCTDIPTIDETNKYLWNYEETVYSIGSSDITEPIIIGHYAQGSDGKDGRGISEIRNYYQVTTNMTVPDTSVLWPTKAPTLTPTNKYLWNYEMIIYTDDTVDVTDPAIIGVYGDSGAGAITFELYSVHGFMFKEDLHSIELKVAAFDGGEAIDGVTYTWEWWNDKLNDGAGGYSTITADTTEQSFIVYETDEYAFASLKCTMNYDNKVYEDYVVLTSETVIYSSVVKFFNGSNIFDGTEPYIVAYVDLFQNNHKVETIFATTYCSGISTVSSSGVITADVQGVFTNGDKMYFICENNDGVYEAVLGEYISNVWKVVDVELQYVYTNTLCPTILSNVIVISKESVNKSQNIDFIIYKDGMQISSTNAIVIDINDPIISTTAPENPKYGQLWLDTSTSPYTIKIFTQTEGKNAGEWVYFAQQEGQTVYTSKPSKYSEGDLWILANGETCGDFKSGSMLKATTSSTTFSASHWVDADEAFTELKNNIKQYFDFDPDTGLKIGQTDENFYVNISSTEMGLYDNSNGNHQKVVAISNNAAVIKNLTVQDGATFDCNVKFNKQVQFGDDFIWKIESNKSLSLAIDS